MISESRRIFLFLNIFCLYIYIQFIQFYPSVFPLFTPQNNTYEFHLIRKMISESRRIFFAFKYILSIHIYIYTIYTILSFSISVAYSSKQTRMIFIQYAKWSVNQGASFLVLNIFCLYIYIYIYIHKLYNSIIQ